jgi:alpha-L-rhamnosidase
MDYTYVQRGGRETFEPFGYLGFRYVQVDVPEGVALPEKVEVILRWNAHDRDRLAHFQSTDETLNAIWELAVHSTRFGSQEHFVDTPTREQGQFTYDAYQISRAAMRIQGERDLTQRALREFAQSQVKFHPDTGKVNAVYPNGDGRRDIPDWTQSWAMWAWEYWLETGDRELVADLFPQLLKTGEYVKGIENPDTGLVDLGNDLGYKSGIVDWPNRYDYDRATTQRTVMSINAVLVYRAIEGLAAALGRTDVAERFRGHALAANAAIQLRLWDDAQSAYVDGLHADGRPSRSASQQTNAMMLACGLAHGARATGAMAAVKRAGFATSPVLSRFLVAAYGAHDEDAALYDWLFTWESWEGASAKSENSESHAYSANAAVDAIQRFVLGVEIVEPQAARVRIRPHVGPLRAAQGLVPTERGDVHVAWEAVPHGVSDLRVRVPENVLADVYVPVPIGRHVSVNDTIEAEVREGRYVVFRDRRPGEHRFRLMQ